MRAFCGLAVAAVIASALAAVLGFAVAGLLVFNVVAHAETLGDIRADRPLDAHCPRTDDLGPTVTSWCTDSHDLTIKSR